MSAWPYHPIIAAVRDIAGAQAAAALPGPRAVFLLGGSIQTLPDIVLPLKKEGKAVFLHLDLIEGIGRDPSGVRYLADNGVQGLISTKAPLIKAARACGMVAVHRVFLLDSGSLESGIHLLAASHADYCEVMPGLVPKAIGRLKGRIPQPIIAGGMITGAQEADIALRAGAVAVSTSERALWEHLPDMPK